MFSYIPLNELLTEYLHEALDRFTFYDDFKILTACQTTFYF